MYLLHCTCTFDGEKNSPAVKEVSARKKVIVKKRCEIQGGSQEMAWLGCFRLV